MKLYEFSGLFIKALAISTDKIFETNRAANMAECAQK